MTGQAQTQGFSQAEFKTQVCDADLRPVRLHQRPLRRRQDLHGVRHDQHHAAGRSNGNFDTTQHRLHAGRPGRHRGGVAVLSVADLRLAARLNLSNLNGGKRLLVATVGVPQRTLLDDGSAS